MGIDFYQGTVRISLRDSRDMLMVLEAEVKDLTQGQGIPGDFPLKVQCSVEQGLGKLQMGTKKQGFQVRLEATAPCTLISATWTGRTRVHLGDMVFFNGYQSWTEGAESYLYQGSSSMGILGRIFEETYHFSAYGDYTFARQSESAGSFHGWTYWRSKLGSRHELMASLGDRGAFTSFHTKAHPLMRLGARLARILLSLGKLELAMPLVITRDVEGRTMEPGAVSGVLDVFSLGYYQGTEDGVFDEWFKDMDIQARTTETCKGWTSWYKYYESIDHDKISQALQGFAKGYQELGGQTTPVFQIDDGWQQGVGDWLKVKEDRFPQGMGVLAQAIKDQGMRPGLWLAPFAAQVDSELVKLHPQWLIRDEDGKPLYGGSNWGGFYGLDILIPGVQEYLRGVFATIINDWGYELVKLDFLYATCMVPRGGLSRGEIMGFAMDFLRSCVGDKKILACGVPLASAFGVVDYCRIGCDVGLDWNGPLKERFIHRERVSTKQSLSNTKARRHLNLRAFLNDPDVWIGRSTPDVKLSAKQKERLHDDNLRYGGLVFCSDLWEEIPVSWRKL